METASASPIHCANHPHVKDVEPCDDCGRPFCGECLATIMGRRLCGSCKHTATLGIVQRRQLHPWAVIVLILPIVSYVTCVLVPIGCPAALILGRRVLQETRGPGPYDGYTLALIGVVLSGAILATSAAGAIAALAYYFLPH